ncbi:hypothetical protein BpHYR1_017913 [Brachionus plicatilis]|uniref:Uncharacterized protein n=1 Tax=Brachionus plicatilis TaxID=10195 RepID=A0A3M7SWW6_BRAPC|nr:hypothetical protein BpHYR1_017913 [Brachionus plicatilis]
MDCSILVSSFSSIKVELENFETIGNIKIDLNVFRVTYINIGNLGLFGKNAKEYRNLIPVLVSDNKFFGLKRKTKKIYIKAQSGHDYFRCKE